MKIVPGTNFVTNRRDSSPLPSNLGTWYEVIMTKPEPTQLDKFKQAARDLEADDDPERFRECVGKLVKHKPVEKPE